MRIGLIETNQLLDLRRTTRTLRHELEADLAKWLRVVTPQLHPRTVLGQHVRGNSAASNRAADQALETLEELYGAFCNTKAFNLRRTFDKPIEIMSATPELSVVEYPYSLGREGPADEVRITAPLRWVVAYRGFGPQALRAQMRKQREAVGSELQTSVVHALVMHLVVMKQPLLSEMFAALRFPISAVPNDELGALPLVTIEAPVSTSRPADDVIRQGTELSGSPAFEELVDVEGLDNLRDPLKERLDGLLCA